MTAAQRVTIRRSEDVRRRVEKYDMDDPREICDRDFAMLQINTKQYNGRDVALYIDGKVCRGTIRGFLIDSTKNRLLCRVALLSGGFINRQPYAIDAFGTDAVRNWHD